MRYSCAVPWLLIGLLAASTVPPYLELRNRRRPTQVYVLDMGLFVGMLVAGWAAIASGPASSPPTWGILLVLAAILIRCGTVPALILGGGVFPQPGVMSRQRATERILKDRESRVKGAELSRPAVVPDVASYRVVEAPHQRSGAAAQGRSPGPSFMALSQGPR